MPSMTVTHRLVYPWKRFWFLRTEIPLPWSEDFLTDPEGLYGPYMTAQPVSQRQLLDAPCLVMLGESGIGKSFWLEAAWPEIEAEITAHGERTLRINLGEYGNEVLLVEDLFGPSGLGGWDPTSQRLHLYLDSLDECQMRC